MHIIEWATERVTFIGILVSNPCKFTANSTQCIAVWIYEFDGDKILLSGSMGRLYNQCYSSIS